MWESGLQWVRKNLVRSRLTDSGLLGLWTVGYRGEDHVGLRSRSLRGREPKVSAQ